MKNPLLETSELPPFSRIESQHISPAVDEILTNNRKSIKDLLAVDGEISWQSFVAPLEDLNDRLNQSWSPVSHMNAVVDSDDFREAHNSSLIKLSEYAIELGQNKDLYRAYKTLSDSKQGASLSVPQRKIIDNALRDFRLMGIELAAAQQERFTEISKRLTELASTFADNVLDATSAWTKLITDESALDGMPTSALDFAHQMAEQRQMEGYLLTLDAPSYIPVMTYCDDRELRYEMYEAFTTRASDQGPNAGKWDNDPLMQETLTLRHEMAQLLSFDNFAHLSLATKMAATTSRVMDFLHQLAEKALPMAKREFQEVSNFAREKFAMEELEAWDIQYYSEKLRLAKYAVSQEELRPYFPVATVLGGMFEVVKRLYDVEITKQSDWDVWHADVLCFEIQKGGAVIARFFLDLYARPRKRGGAWMDECRVRRRTKDGGLQLPVAYLTCNFTFPVGDNPALLTHTEVVTLFHEFGHGLHHMLTRVEEAGVSGTNGVARDAVELPSQFMENWCWQPQALELISGHFETGESLPADLLAKLLAAKNFQAAMSMVRQLEFALFDFQLHLEFEEDIDDQIQTVLDSVRERVSVFATPPFNKFQNGFSHIFAGGYAAGYYSYKWAEVLSADAFARFQEQGIFNRQTGEKFLQNILARGGSVEPMDLFVAFRGREPDINALLRQDGIID